MFFKRPTKPQPTDEEAPVVSSARRDYTSPMRGIGTLGFTKQVQNKILTRNNEYCATDGFFKFGQGSYKLVYTRIPTTMCTLLYKYQKNGQDVCAFIEVPFFKDESINVTKYELFKYARNIVQELTDLRLKITRGESTVGDMITTIQNRLKYLRNIDESDYTNSPYQRIEDITNLAFRPESPSRRSWDMLWNPYLARIQNILLSKLQWTKPMVNEYNQIKEWENIMQKYQLKLRTQETFMYVPAEDLFNVMKALKYKIEKLHKYYDASSADYEKLDRTSNARREFISWLNRDINNVTTSGGGKYKKTSRKIQTAKGKRCVYVGDKGKEFIKMNGKFICHKTRK